MLKATSDRANQAKYQEWITRNPQALENWRRQNPHQLLDCAEIDLSNVSLEGRDLSYIDFTGADFQGAVLSSSSFKKSKLERANFDAANLANANLKGADLSRANFRGAVLIGARLEDALYERTIFDGAKLDGCSVTQGANMRGSSFVRASLKTCVLRFVSFESCDLSHSRIDDSNCANACFDHAELKEASLKNANLVGCSFYRSILLGASLELADLEKATLEGAFLRETSVSGAKFMFVRGLSRCYDLDRVRIGNSLPSYVDLVSVPAIDRLLSWDMLRVVGRLPLFAVSYFALILMPFLFYLLEMFNNKVDQIRKVAASVPAESMRGFLAKGILDHLHAEPVPRLSFLLFICTIVLAIGATIYAVLCPPRIKEFSRDQWRDQLGRSLLHYLPFSWKHRWARLACAACYALGGGGVLLVLLSKLAGALVYLARAELA